MTNTDCTARSIAARGAEWTLDGDASVQSVVERDDCPELIRQALTRLFSWQVRVETSVRRALASPRLAPPFVAVLLALGADVTIGEDDDAQRVPVRSFVEGVAKGRLSAIHLPVCGGQRRCGQAVVARTPVDDPIVAAYAAVELDGARICQARVALTGVWPEPARLAQAPRDLVGGRASLPVIERVAAKVAQEVAPQGDYLGTAEYRVAMAEVLTRRALAACLLERGSAQ
jgi:CO/xanthine dehydrogenase FAD-binding subunit